MQINSQSQFDSPSGGLCIAAKTFQYLLLVKNVGSVEILEKCDAVFFCREISVHTLSAIAIDIAPFSEFLMHVSLVFTADICIC